MSNPSRVLCDTSILLSWTIYASNGTHNSLSFRFSSIFLQLYGIFRWISSYDHRFAYPTLYDNQSYDDLSSFMCLIIGNCSLSANGLLFAYQKQIIKILRSYCRNCKKGQTIFWKISYYLLFNHVHYLKVQQLFDYSLFPERTLHFLPSRNVFW